MRHFAKWSYERKLKWTNKRMGNGLYKNLKYQTFFGNAPNVEQLFIQNQSKTEKSFINTVGNAEQ